MHTGDRLVSLDGHPVATAMDFRSWLGQLRVGQTARMQIIHDGAMSRVEVLVTGYDRPTVRIDEVADATTEQQRLRVQWLTAAR